MRRWALCLLALLLGSLPRTSAHAHDLRGTIVLLDVGTQALDAELQLPVDELRAALGEPRAAPGTPLQVSTAALANYVRGHFAVTTPDGLPFVLTLHEVTRERIDDGDAMVARLSLRAPAGHSARSFVVHDDLIMHRVITHNGYVFVRRDPWSGLLPDAPRLLGVLHYQQHELAVDRGEGSAWKGFSSTFRLGVRHIAEGTDHLLFLLTLLLPACLLATGPRWGARKTLVSSVRHTLYVTSAFSIGHSLTLLLGTLQVARIDAQLVEVAIALSILVSAAHAVRPLFAGHETWVAASFGLVHGLAFASVLSGMGVDGSTLTIALLGFTLGIELMQLAVVLLFVPWLYVLAGTPVYSALRVMMALLAALLAGNWVIERALQIETPLSPTLDALAEHAAWSLPLIIVSALLAAARARK